MDAGGCLELQVDAYRGSHPVGSAVLGEAAGRSCVDGPVMKPKPRSEPMLPRKPVMNFSLPAEGRCLSLSQGLHICADVLRVRATLDPGPRLLGGALMCATVTRIMLLLVCL